VKYSLWQPWVETGEQCEFTTVGFMFASLLLSSFSCCKKRGACLCVFFFFSTVRLGSSGDHKYLFFFLS
jgi:hypothetical protein